MGRPWSSTHPFDSLPTVTELLRTLPMNSGATMIERSKRA